MRPLILSDLKETSTMQNALPGYNISSQHVEKILSWNPLTIDSAFMDHFSDEEMVKYFYENSITQIDIHALKGENNSKYLERFNRILTQNFPLVETLRLIAGNHLVNINISWVKNINDIAGKKFCDLVISHFKAFCRNNLENASQNHYKTRVVKDDYRNIAFVWIFWDVQKTFFWNIKNKPSVIRELLNTLDLDIKKRAQEMADEKIKLWELCPKTPQEYKDFVWDMITKITHTIQDHFNFWVSQIVIPKESNDIDKLNILRQSEISSKKWILDKRNISIHTYDEEMIFSLLSKAEELEKSIIEKYWKTQFIFDWVEYNVIFEGNGEQKISTELLRYVRKYPSLVSPKELVSQIENYMQSLNLALDYIPPIRWDISNIATDFRIATSINNQMFSGMIQSDFLFQSFKWGYTKEAFICATKNKKWIRISMDIKDMGIDNIFDFNKIRKQIFELRRKYSSLEIPPEVYHEKLNILFLNAGKSVTDKFREVRLRIKEKYPNGIIRFGWDEIELFLPDTSKSQLGEIESHIQQTLNASGQKARIMIDTTLGFDDSEFAFSQLDRMWKINKMVEEVLEQNIHESHFWDMPNCTYLKMDTFTKNIIFRPGFHLNDFIKMVRIRLWESMINFWNTSEICVWDCGNNIQLTLKQKNIFELEIYLHN